MANGTAPTTTARPEAREYLSGPPVETQGPKPGEVWRWQGHGGGDVRVVRVDGSRVIYERSGWDELFSAPLVSWHIEFSRVEAKPTTPPDYQADVRAFHEALVPDQVADRPTMPTERIRELRLALIEEEFDELKKAIAARDLVAVADAIADLLYVTYGTAVACGIDIAPIWREVHRSNMAKEGGPTRADGKILKPEGWTAPDVRGELIRQGWRDPADAATTVQPTPRGTGREITPLVIADLEARSRIGAEKYGEPLTAHNGRDPLVDAYQEALDLVQYLRQAIEERGGMPQTGGDDE